MLELQKRVNTPSLCHAGYGTQGFPQTRQTLLHPSYTFITSAVDVCSKKIILEITILNILILFPEVCHTTIQFPYSILYHNLQIIINFPYLEKGMDSNV